jgi:hypothetical protein
LKGSRKRKRCYSVRPRQRHIGVRVFRWMVGRRGIGHFIGIALGVSASLMFFNMVYPVASTMFQGSITTMQTINSKGIGYLNGT